MYAWVGKFLGGAVLLAGVELLELMVLSRAVIETPDMMAEVN